MITEHKINKSENFICGYYDDDYSMIDEILEFYNNHTEKSQGKILFADNQATVDPEIKLSTEISLEYNTDLMTRYLRVYLQPKLLKYIERYSYANNYSPWSVVESINIQQYQPKEGYFSWHTERTMAWSTATNRHLVFMTYLNDVTDEGETEFYYQKCKIKPEKGLTLFWPTDWTFTHRGITSPTQTKTVITGWYSYI